MYINPRRSAFTIVELLVVIAVMAILVACLMPAISKARDTARFIGCASSLRQCMIVESMYLNDNRQWFQTYDYSGYDFNFTVYNQYLGGDHTRLFQKGCPGRLTKNEWSYGTNGSIRYWVAVNPPVYPYYNTSHAAKLDDVLRPSATHLFTDMVGYFRYPNYGFLDTYVLGPAPPRAFRHEGKGLGFSYVDGHADYHKNEPGYDGTPWPIWHATWHYAYGCATDGCFWHAYNSLKH